ncbi:hypothetical protein CC78DRAFT_533274 [Lojkania enalia]|uniref:Uncharacterized protein n=1 Tax=Lojkania enalia TaxID=147567 RepID=A0A9P4K880_9PLEO|nr:hypothetical protein CC78DRAFT_533274 [Didymosphaeria enalia]
MHRVLMWKTTPASLNGETAAVPSWKSLLVVASSPAGASRSILDVGIYRVVAARFGPFDMTMLYLAQALKTYVPNNASH